MSNIARKARSIKLVLLGSSWATDHQTRIVLNEIDELISTLRLRNRNRKVSLQIFYSSRAVDTMLVWICNWDLLRQGRVQLPPAMSTIGGALTYINGNRPRGIAANMINGNMFSAPTLSGINLNIKQHRNKYLHQAGEFPSDQELEDFLDHTLIALREISTWRP